MLESVTIGASTVVGASIVLLVLVFLRFGDEFVDRLVSYGSSPVEAIEETIPERE